MQRALELAERGRQLVSPNPMVGCVIVHNGLVIGEGYHQIYGGPHAEVNAIKNVKDPELFKDSTLYVTLEPCSHYGKTPPCANLIVESGLHSVVVCNKDPNPLVAGKGVDLLKGAGIEVFEGMLERQGLALNRRFFTYHTQKRPYIILKWAQTADGFVSRSNFDSKWISDEFSRTVSHKWRSEEDAIFVGTNTAIYDNPSLTNRDWSGGSPIRVLLDRALKVPKSSNLFDNSVVTICYNSQMSGLEGKNSFVKLDFNHEILPQILNDLFLRKVQSIIVEGGSTLLNTFIDQNIWDEARVFISKKESFSMGIPAPILSNLMLQSIEDLIGDRLLTYRNHG